MLPASAPDGDRARVAPADAGEHGHGAGQRERGAEALQHRPAISISNELAKPHTSEAAENRPSPMPANTWPRMRRSSGSTASAPTTIAMLYAVIVHDTPTIETSKVP